ncbi:four-carbon acid sugar kinase family protein [Mycolicibacterium mageritense]|uniref:four-carbon acid sugar kinase family protein n=1 Tax=Mycolicibacterium mageritense TaxID=53462 RepID=UPI0022A8624D|nr:four-carbon acid sugar kinase family protein [Mycolicibacterium mageritense]
MSAPALGCIADDYTGGTDVAAALRRRGLRVMLFFGPPDDGFSATDCDAVVVALKTRALDAGTAVAMSLAAQRWLVDVVHVRTVLLQILLDVRLHPGRQHRSGHRRTARRGGRAGHGDLPCHTGTRPHRLSGPPVRR